MTHFDCSCISLIDSPHIGHVQEAWLLGWLMTLMVMSIWISSPTLSALKDKLNIIILMTYCFDEPIEVSRASPYYLTLCPFREIPFPTLTAELVLSVYKVDLKCWNYFYQQLKKIKDYHYMMWWKLYKSMINDAYIKLINTSPCFLQDFGHFGCHFGWCCQL